MEESNVLCIILGLMVVRVVMMGELAPAEIKEKHAPTASLSFCI